MTQKNSPHLYEAINTVSDTCTTKKSIVKQNLDNLARRIAGHISNKNQSIEVVRASLNCYTHLFEEFSGKKGMDRYLVFIVPTLISRTGDNQEPIIVRSADHVTMKMLQSCSLKRLFKFLFQTFDKQPAIKIKVAHYTCKLISCRTANLITDRELINSVIVKIAPWLYEANPTVRENTRDAIKDMINAAEDKGNMKKEMMTIAKKNDVFSERFNTAMNTLKSNGGSIRGRKPRRALHEPKQKPIRNSKNPISKIVVPVKVNRKGRVRRKSPAAKEQIDSSLSSLSSLREQIDNLVLQQKKTEENRN